MKPWLSYFYYTPGEKKVLKEFSIHVTADLKEPDKVRKAGASNNTHVSIMISCHHHNEQGF